MDFSRNSLLIMAYAIGCFDLVSALLFSMVSFKTICEHVRKSFFLLVNIENCVKSSYLTAELADNICGNFWTFLDIDDSDAPAWHS